MASRTFCSAGDGAASRRATTQIVSVIGNRIRINIGTHSKYAEKRGALKGRYAVSSIRRSRKRSTPNVPSAVVTAFDRRNRRSHDATGWRDAELTAAARTTTVFSRFAGG